MSNKEQLQENNETLATLVEAMAKNPTATELQRGVETNAENIEKLSVDYIVERGNDSGWNYEKWNSGKCVLERRVTYMATRVGANYITVPYPFELKSEPRFHMTIPRNHNVCKQVFPTNGGGNYSDEFKVLDVLFWDVQDTSYACYVDVEVISTWK